jgi:hypothetical protein
LEDGKSAILRFLTEFEGEDSWIVVHQHQMVPTRPAPKGYTGEWPKTMGAVCRTTADEDGNPMHPECFICDYVQIKGKKAKRSARGWALACLREEVIENGKVVGYKDQKRDVTKKDEAGNETTTTERAIVVVNLSYQNFFSDLEFAGKHHETVLDRDYKVTRKGAGLDTDYKIVALEPQTFISESEKDANGQPLVKRWDPRDPEIAPRYQTDLDLASEVHRLMSDEFYARFFDTRVPQPTNEGEKGGGAATPPKPSTDVEEGALGAMASRVLGYAPNADGTEGNGDGAEPQAAESAAEAAPQEEPTPEPAGAGPRPMALDD